MNLVKTIFCTGLLLVGVASFATSPEPKDPEADTEATAVECRSCKAKNMLNEKRTDPSRMQQEKTMAMIGAPNEKAKAQAGGDKAKATD